MPAVREAAFATALPGDDGGRGVDVSAEAHPRAAGEEIAASSVGITPTFFAALNRPLIAGRTFTEAEAADPRPNVAIINPELARTLFPGEDPLGQRIAFNDGYFTVVGIAPTLQYEEIGEETPQSRRQIHVPYAHEGWRQMTLVVRAQGDPAGAAGAVRRSMREMDGTLPVFDVRTMEEMRAYTTWDKRIFGEVFASFGLLALALAFVGVFGVTAYGVSQRTREIGIRMALGARSLDVLREVGRQGSTAVGVGVVTGLVLAWGASRAMRSVLYGVAPSDPISFVTVPLVLVVAAVVATLIPARRATRVDPIVALRSE
jgi:predicted permease